MFSQGSIFAAKQAQLRIRRREGELTAYSMIIKIFPEYFCRNLRHWSLLLGRQKIEFGVRAIQDAPDLSTRQAGQPFCKLRVI